MTRGVTDGSGEKVQRPTQHRRSPWVALFLLLALGLTLAGIFPFRQMLAQQRQVANTEAKLEAVVEENRQLEGQIASLRTDAGVERLAHRLPARSYSRRGGRRLTSRKAVSKRRR